MRCALYNVMYLAEDALDGGQGCVFLHVKVAVYFYYTGKVGMR